MVELGSRKRDCCIENRRKQPLNEEDAQLLSLSSRGYRAITPDLRGYDDTDAPPSAASYSSLHIIDDLVSLLDSLGLEQVFLVAHDWGAVIAWYFCFFRPDRIKVLVNTSVVFRPRHPSRKPIESLLAIFGDDYYICRFQQQQIVDGERMVARPIHDASDIVKSRQISLWNVIFISWDKLVSTDVSAREYVEVVELCLLNWPLWDKVGHFYLVMFSEEDEDERVWWVPRDTRESFKY